MEALELTKCCYCGGLEPPDGFSKTRHGNDACAGYSCLRAFSESARKLADGIDAEILAEMTRVPAETPRRGGGVFASEVRKVDEVVVLGSGTSNDPGNKWQCWAVIRTGAKPRQCSNTSRNGSCFCWVHKGRNK